MIKTEMHIHDTISHLSSQSAVVIRMLALYWVSKCWFREVPDLLRWLIILASEDIGRLIEGAPKCHSSRSAFEFIGMPEGFIQLLKQVLYCPRLRTQIRQWQSLKRSIKSKRGRWRNTTFWWIPPGCNRPRHGSGYQFHIFPGRALCSQQFLLIQSWRFLWAYDEGNGKRKQRKLARLKRFDTKIG